MYGALNGLGDGCPLKHHKTHLCVVYSSLMMCIYIYYKSVLCLVGGQARHLKSENLVVTNRSPAAGFQVGAAPSAATAEDSDEDLAGHPSVVA